ncbi:MAG: proline hydroxylase [Euryarchaeota archaeon]|nr:proline hydroxylase [Euryarchaeota archaeon]
MNNPDIIGLFDSKRYNKLSIKNSNKYQNGKPFPNINFKNFLRNDVAELLSNNFPNYNSNKWIKYKNYNTTKNSNLKKSIHDERKFPKIFRSIFREFNSRQFLLFLESLTGIENLIPDPYFLGGGIHSARKGGFLNIHTDFNWHHKLQLHRRVNVLIYLTKNWRKEYQGCLELWNKNKTKKILEYQPLYNSCIIFNTSAISYHGHPVPVNGSDNIFRNVLNLYYYTAHRKKSEIYNPTFTNYGKLKKEKIIKKKFKINSNPWCMSLLREYKKIK